MFVVVNVLVPALLMAGADTLSGGSYSPALAWLPENMLTVVGLVGGLGALLVALVLGRCHKGMVINGAKLGKVVRGQLTTRGLNWLGVTTNLVALSALSAGSGIFLALASLGLPIGAALGGGVFALVLPLVVLAASHARANRLARLLEPKWNHGPVPAELLEEHATQSLDDVTSDVAVVVTMVVALFAGAFGALSNLGAIPAELNLPLSVADLQRIGVPALAGFLTLSILLSLRMVVRLRIALAEHAQRLAELRGEVDQPWRFQPLERTFLLYAVGLLLAAASAVILVWSQTGAREGLLAGAAIALLGAVYYPVSLRLARRS